MRSDEKTQVNLEVNELIKTVEDLQLVKDKLQKSEEMYRFLAENSMDAIWRFDNQFRFIYVSPAAKNIFGFQNEEIVGRHLFSILTPESINAVKRGYANRKSLQEEGQKWGSSTYTVEAIRKDGHHIWVEVTVNPIFDADNRLMGYNGITRDISERRRNEEVIRKYALHDPLTNLPNRRFFEDILGRAVVRNRQLDKPFAVMFLDVDGLKKVNDENGHLAGDVLLQVVADRLRHAVREQDFVARLAGDEFMAILPGIGDNGAVSLIATRLLKSCHQPIVIGTSKMSVSVSIGISFFPTDADNVSTLMNYADQAMYRAKETGGDNYICYGQKKII